MPTTINPCGRSPVEASGRTITQTFNNKGGPDQRGAKADAISDTTGDEQPRAAPKAE